MIGKLIDHTLLKSTATIGDIIKHCEDANDFGAFSVCVMPSYVKVADAVLHRSSVKVCTVVGFPLGATPAEVKAFEAKTAVEDGADEIDMVINIGMAKSGNLEGILEEINIVKAAIGDTLLKVIVETSEFNEEEKEALYEIVAKSDAEYIKTSTGTTAKGATLYDIALMFAIGKGRYKIKASGGVNNLETLNNMVTVGADRIGTSGGIRIMAELKGENVEGVELSAY